MIERIRAREDQQFAQRNARFGTVENSFELCAVEQAQLLLEACACHASRELFAQAESRLRPLARRRLSTSRPLRVAIRARKPWVRLRFRLLG